MNAKTQHNFASKKGPAEGHFLLRILGGRTYNATFFAIMKFHDCCGRIERHPFIRVDIHEENSVGKVNYNGVSLINRDIKISLRNCPIW